MLNIFTAIYTVIVSVVLFSVLGTLVTIGWILFPRRK